MPQLPEDPSSVSFDLDARRVVRDHDEMARIAELEHAVRSNPHLPEVIDLVRRRVDLQEREARARLARTRESVRGEGYPDVDDDVEYLLEDCSGIKKETYAELRSALHERLAVVRDAAKLCWNEMDRQMRYHSQLRPMPVADIEGHRRYVIGRFLKARQEIINKYQSYLRNLKWLEQAAKRQRRGCLTPRQNNILRIWLFSNFHNPYPEPSVKKQLSEETGMTLTQINNWFINARVRVWKPTVELMTGDRMERDGGPPSPPKLHEERPSRRAQLIGSAMLGSTAGRNDVLSLPFGHGKAPTVASKEELVERMAAIASARSSNDIHSFKEYIPSAGSHRNPGACTSVPRSNARLPHMQKEFLGHSSGVECSHVMTRQSGHQNGFFENENNRTSPALMSPQQSAFVENGHRVRDSASNRTNAVNSINGALPSLSHRPWVTEDPQQPLSSVGHTAPGIESGNTSGPATHEALLDTVIAAGSASGGDMYGSRDPYRSGHDTGFASTQRDGGQQYSHTAQRGASYGSGTFAENASRGTHYASAMQSRAQSSATQHCYQRSVGSGADEMMRDGSSRAAGSFEANREGRNHQVGSRRPPFYPQIHERLASSEGLGNIPFAPLGSQQTSGAYLETYRQHRSESTCTPHAVLMSTYSDAAESQGTAMMYQAHSQASAMQFGDSTSRPLYQSSSAVSGHRTPGGGYPSSQYARTPAISQSQGPMQHEVSLPQLHPQQNLTQNPPQHGRANAGHPPPQHSQRPTQLEFPSFRQYSHHNSPHQRA